MKSGSLKFLSAAFALLATTAGAAPIQPLIGKAMPNFVLKDTKGTAHDLGQYRGKVVVLSLFGYG